MYSLLKIILVGCHALWTRLISPRSRREEMLNDFAGGWASNRADTSKEAFTSEEEALLATLWTLYVGAGGEKFALKWSTIVNRKIAWKQATETRA